MLWIVIPAKAPPYAKSRLSRALTDVRRGELVEAMARRTLLVAREAAPTANILLVSNSHSFRVMARSFGADAIADRGEGINQALRDADATLPPGESMLVLPTDLLSLAAEDVAAITHTQAGCAIAPNRERTGTNALFWKRGPRAFCFGNGSFDAHIEAAAKQKMSVDIINRPGLAFDVDEPDDLELWRCRQSDPFFAGTSKYHPGEDSRMSTGAMPTLSML